MPSAASPSQKTSSPGRDATELGDRVDGRPGVRVEPGEQLLSRELAGDPLEIVALTQQCVLAPLQRVVDLANVASVGAPGSARADHLHAVRCRDVTKPGEHLAARRIDRGDAPAVEDDVVDSFEHGAHGRETTVSAAAK